MLVNRDLEDNRLMALNHYFAWQKKKDQSPQLIKYPPNPKVLCPGTLPPTSCPPRALLVTAHLHVCAEGHKTGVISVHPWEIWL